VDSENVERRLAAILSADAVGYSRLMAEDEAGTIRTLTAYRHQISGLVSDHRGRVVDAPGDNVLAEFRTALDAVECGVEIQRVIRARNAGIPAERQMQFRVGIHMGDVAAEGDRIYGSGVNIAARLEALAEPGGICISAAVHEQVESRLDLGYEDLGEQSVKNIPKPVRVYRVQLDAGRADAPRSAGRGWARLRIAAASLASLIVLVAAALWLSWPAPLGLVLDVAGLSGPPVNPPLPDEPSIVVLPFDNMSGDPEQEYFADGITEELTTDLSQNPALFVIARNSAFTYKSAPVNVEQVGRELGVRYVLEGSVRKVGNRVRITAQLIDATTGFHLWSEAFDRDLNEIFALQTEISERITGALGMEIPRAEYERIRQAPTDSLSAYDSFFRGLRHFVEFTREGFEKSRPFFERAIELDPGFAQAHASLGATYLLEHLQGWNLDDALLDRALALGERALALDPENPVALNLIGAVLMSRGRLAEARVFAERTVEANPNWNVAHFVLALHQAQSGELLDAIRSANFALRLNPRAPAGELGAIGAAYFAAGRTDKAVELWERVRAANPDLLLSRVGLAVFYESQARHEDAQVLVQEILHVNSNLSAELLMELPAMRLLAAGAAGRAEIVEHLRSAGLP